MTLKTFRYENNQCTCWKKKKKKGMQENLRHSNIQQIKA